MSREIAIDVHVHLWQEQQGIVDGRPVFGVGGGKSNFGGEVRQMMPPYMDDDRNTAERLIANMDYAGVSGCVVTQEYIDGNQDDYLLACKEKYKNRLKICSLYEERPYFHTEGFDGIKICAGRLADRDLKKVLPVFSEAQRQGKFISIDLADGDEQVADMEFLIKACPDLKIAIGHFGMVTTCGWQKQIELAKYKNVFIESGGLTWLFSSEGYPFLSAVDAVCEARDICGMEKLMWGSDYPRTMTEITYKMSVEFIRCTNKLTVDEKRMFLRENAVGFYGFDNVAEMEEIPNML